MRANLPPSAGVYIFKGKDGKPIYIGKAVNIASRVKGHLSNAKNDPKERLIIEKLSSIETILVGSEMEALLLEANLIKKFVPPYNSNLKDDKDYLYIKITAEKFPRVLTARKKDLGDAKVFFGPFPSASKVRITLKLLRRIFPYSICKPNQKRPCLAFHLGLCPGVCNGKISETEYQKNIRNLKLFLEGKINSAKRELEKQRETESKNLDFERAADTQAKIEAIGYITRPVRAFEEYIETDFVRLRQKESEELAKVLGLARTPSRIECYDISNIYGQQAVGSMVVFTDGAADKDQYRRFKIKKVIGINDFAMIAEVLERRFGNSWKIPDLIVIDGGKGQLSAAASVLRKLGLEIPVISLAKRLEEIYVPGNPNSIRLERSSDALKLVQRLRDEAHRFAITYHRKVRSLDFLTKRIV